MYGSVEGNFIHALNKKPENIFMHRNEEEIVLGNAGVVLIEEKGSKVMNVDVGDVCIYFCNGDPDEFGFPRKITAYDKPNSMGLFSKKIKLKNFEVIKIPSDTKYSLQQWAAFSLKYITAWSNWKVAYNAWRLQMSEVPPEDTYVFGWGGGVTFAELSLAKSIGCQCYLMTSKTERIDQLENAGIVGVDRIKMMKNEKNFLEYVRKVTNKRGVSIFIDNIGQSVYKTTLKTLGRQGVIATSGWKTGGMLPISRASECQNRHIHVYTHYASYNEGIEAVEYAEANNWVPLITGKEYDWEEIPQLLQDYKNGEIISYFPIYKIN